MAVLIEAMAAGTPWVSYDVGNVAELPGGIVAASDAELLDNLMLLDDGEEAAALDQLKGLYPDGN